MAEAVSRQRWAHTSAVMCVIANCHRDPKKTRPFTPADFDPYRNRIGLKFSLQACSIHPTIRAMEHQGRRQGQRI
ncbi:MAG: hypothetical protein MUF18_20530 [Fimbriiglobus sp.]|jgi:hypothetical protein|nr:hypothetical protein [Fimbriiglobus sp.]